MSRPIKLTEFRPEERLQRRLGALEEKAASNIGLPYSTTKAMTSNVLNVKSTTPADVPGCTFTTPFGGKWRVIWVMDCEVNAAMGATQINVGGSLQGIEARLHNVGVQRVTVGSLLETNEIASGTIIKMQLYINFGIEASFFSAHTRMNVERIG